MKLREFFRRFFKGVSWPQLLASALSALTVFLLTIKIGIAGSIIGAIVASVISTFSSQLYRNILEESSKKIKKTAHGKNGVSDSDKDDEKSAEKKDEKEGITNKTVDNGVTDKAISNKNVADEEDEEITKAVHRVAPNDVQEIAKKVVHKDIAAQARSVSSHTAKPVNIPPLPPISLSSIPAISPSPIGNSQSISNNPKKINTVVNSTAHSVIDITHVHQVRTADENDSQYFAENSSPSRESNPLKLRLKIIAVAILSSVITIGITSGIIMWATQGAGTGNQLIPSDRMAARTPQPTNKQSEANPSLNSSQRSQNSSNSASTNTGQNVDTTQEENSPSPTVENSPSITTEGTTTNPHQSAQNGSNATGNVTQNPSVPESNQSNANNSSSSSTSSSPSNTESNTTSSNSSSTGPSSKSKDKSRGSDIATAPSAVGLSNVDKSHKKNVTYKE